MSIIQFQLFEIAKPKTVLSLPDCLRFDKTIKVEGELLRLLLGTVKVKDVINNLSFNQSKNYSKFGVLINSAVSQRTFTSFLDPSYSLLDLDNYLVKSNPKNILFYKNIRSEFCHVFLNSKRKEYLMAFLHLYRLLEHISYTIPLLYAASSSDYMGTFSKLQDYFLNSKSELKFLSEFLKVFIDDHLLGATHKINITAINPDVQKKYFSIIRMLCDNDKNVKIVSTTEFSEIEIENRGFLHLMIEIRNKYFHFLSGGFNNVSTLDLINPNDFFKLFIDDFINWISFILFEIMRFRIKNL